MTDDTRLAQLRVLARELHREMSEGGPPEAAGWADELTRHGITAKMHEGMDPDSFDEMTSLEWALGQFVDIVQHKAWFAMNASLGQLTMLDDQ